MPKQITNTILMIRPRAFQANSETLVNNYFQHSLGERSNEEIQQQALKEFDGLVNLLQTNDVEVLVYEDTIHPLKPDAIFPNNWISLHENGNILVYPMFAPNRRLERRADIISDLKKNFVVKELIDFTNAENSYCFLEGTGSLVLDRQHQIAYAALSDRTMPSVIKSFEKKTGFKCITFHASQTINAERLPIYHTNVMMYVGESFALICLHSIDDQEERELVKSHLYQTGKEIIEIDEEQLDQFAGNGLQIINNKGERLIVMSSTAFNTLNISQINQLVSHGRIVHADLKTIEHFGGGSARCMMAEVFLPRSI